MFVSLQPKYDKMKHLLIIIGCILLFSSCHGDTPDNETPTKPVDPARRTVIVYMSGENDLHRYNCIENDIDEMITGRKLAAADESLVVFVDKPSTQEMPFIAKVTTNDRQPLDTLYIYEQDFYASDPDCMTEVLNRCIQLCPATEDYGLVLWGHADGWIIEQDSVPVSNQNRAYGRDSGNNTASTSTGKWLNIPSMRKALELLPVKWKFIFADCCNMQSIETAYELRDQAEYFIASPAEITGDGAPYTAIVKDFFIHDDKEMYKAVCDDYYAQKTNYLGRGDEHLPISVIKMECTPYLATATKEVLAQVNSYLTQPNATQGLIYYYTYDMRFEREKVLYDMNDVILNALTEHPDAYQNWRNVFDQTVVYSRTSALWHGLHLNFNDFNATPERQGVVSMFFPLAKYEDPIISHTYNESIRKLEWYYAVGWSELGW